MGFRAQGRWPAHRGEVSVVEHMHTLCVWNLGLDLISNIAKYIMGFSNIEFQHPSPQQCPLTSTNDPVSPRVPSCLQDRHFFSLWSPWVTVLLLRGFTRDASPPQHHQLWLHSGHLPPPLLLFSPPHAKAPTLSLTSLHPLLPLW